MEQILGRRVCADTGTLLYHLQWTGYSTEHNSWEPRCNLVSCIGDDVRETDLGAQQETERLLLRWKEERIGQLEERTEIDKKSIAMLMNGSLTTKIVEGQLCSTKCEKKEDEEEEQEQPEEGS